MVFSRRWVTVIEADLEAFSPRLLVWPGGAGSRRPSARLHDWCIAMVVKLWPRLSHHSLMPRCPHAVTPTRLQDDYAFMPIRRYADMPMDPPYVDVTPCVYFQLTTTPTCACTPTLTFHAYSCAFACAPLALQLWVRVMCYPALRLYL